MKDFVKAQTIWALVVCTVFAIFAFPVSAQPPIAVADKSADNTKTSAIRPALCHFDTAMQLLAEQSHTAFVVEGEPFKTTLNEAEAQRITVNASPEQLIEQVALSYDYAVQRQKGGKVYVFKKRYSNPDDLPYLTLSEVSLTLSDLLALFEPYRVSTKPAEGQRLVDFGLSLTPEQTAALRDPKRGLPVSELNPVQRAQVARLPLFFYANDIALHLLGGQHEVLASPTAFVGWGSTREMNFFGYGALLNMKNAQWYFRPLSHPDTVRSRGDGTVEFLRKTRTDSDATAPVLTVPATSPQAKAAPLAIPLREGAVTAVGSEAGSAFPIIVDEEIASKPVILINAKAAPAESVMRGLADVYGLLLTVQADGTHRIRRPRLPKVDNLSQLPRALEQMVPTPFLHALHRQEKADMEPEALGTLQATPTSAAKTKIDEQANPSFLIQKMHDAMMPVNSDSLRLASVRRLRTTVEPRLAEQKKRRIPLSSLNDAERANLALILMTDIWPELLRHMNPTVPDYVTHFIQGGPGDGFLIGGFTNKDVSVESARDDPRKLGNFEITLATRNEAGKLTAQLLYTEMASPPEKKK